MLSPQALISGIVSRVLPGFNADGASNDVKARVDSYGALYTQPSIRKNYVPAEEGTQFIVTNNQTGIVPTYGTAFASTNPFITVFNNTPLRLEMDYINLVAIVAGASTTTQGYTAIAAVVDAGNRYSSGGTVLANAGTNLVIPNIAQSAAPAVTIACGAITATAATPSARTIVGIRNIRPALSTTVVNVVGDTNVFNFGGVEAAMSGSISITAGQSNIIPMPMPGIIVAPNSTLLFYIWYPVMSAPSAATYAPEISFWLR